MVRRGSSFAALLLVSLMACSGGDDGADADDEAEAAPVTVPDDADPGLGYLVLDGVPHLLQVRDCSLEATTDPASGATTEVAIDADDSVSMAVSITRTVVPGDLSTTTDNITIAENNQFASESQRVDISGNYQDLRAPGALAPLLQVDDTLVTASGVFGPYGSLAGDAGLVEGTLTIRCP